MSERQDYVALEWVSTEIADTLAQASESLQGYLDNRQDATRLRFCLTHIHQVVGTLQMVEFVSAALLAEEMELLVTALLENEVAETHQDDALQALATAIDALPRYLQQVKTHHHSLPAALLPLMNDLRAVRGQSLLSESLLFSPSIPAVDAAPAIELPVAAEELHEVVQKLRQMYQIALLGLIRGRDTEKNLNYLAKVCARFSKLSAGQPPEALWKIAIALLEGLLNRSIELSIAVKILLRQLDRQIKWVLDQGESALVQPPPEQLVKNLLYYVARSDANSRYISAIKQEYQLDSTLLGSAQLDAEQPVEAASDALNAVYSSLSISLRDLIGHLQRPGDMALADMLPPMHSLLDSMAILGLSAELKQLRQPFTQLAASGQHLSEAQRQPMIEAMQALLQQLQQAQPQSAGEKDLFLQSEEAQSQLDSAFLSVIAECRENLEQAKDAIIEFVANQWDRSCLEQVPETLHGVEGSLAMVPLPRAADIVGACRRYVGEQLLTSDAVPDWQVLDTLADAITSIDYYLERIVEPGEQGDARILLVAEESVASLGYPVSDVLPSELPQPPQDISAENATDEEDSDAHGGERIDFDWQAQGDEEPAEKPLAEVIPLASRQSAPVADATEEVSESEAEAAAEPTASPANSNAGLQLAADEHRPLQLDEEFDPEIAEIFLEEAEEVLQEIEQQLPALQQNPADSEPLATVRRCFHTLKGSGRMAKAEDIGELGWAVENMLNRSIDGSVTMDQTRLELIQQVVALLPAMRDAFARQLHLDDDALVTALRQRADDLAAEQDPAQNSLAPWLQSAEPAAATTTAEDTSSSPVAADDELPADSDGQPLQEEPFDAELMQIFASEAVAHLHTLDHFIAHCNDVSGPVVISEDLQRALHTLKGSANMASVEPVAVIAVPLENLVKELRASQLKVDDSVLAVLERASRYIKEAIDQLLHDPQAPLADSEPLLAEIAALEAQKIAVAGSDHGEDGSIDPSAQSDFLARSLDRLQACAQHCAQWQQLGSADQAIPLIDQLDQLVEQASAINLLTISEFGQELMALFRRGAEAEMALPEAFYALANQGLDALLDMLDQLAAQQEPVFDTALFERIDQFQLSPEVAVEDAGQSPQDLNPEQSEELLEAALVEELEEVEPDDSVDLSLLNELQSVDGDVIDLSAIENGEQPLFDVADAMQQMAEAVATDAADNAVDIEVSADVELEVDEEPESVAIADDAQTLVDDLAAIANGATEYAEPTAATDESLAAAADEDEVDPEILEIFLEEADDLLESIDDTLHKWNDDRENPSYLDDLQRFLHTLKGGARLSNLTQLGDVSHDCETFLEQAAARQTQIDDDFIARVQGYQDGLIKLVEAARSGEAVAQPMIEMPQTTTAEAPAAEMPAEAEPDAEIVETTVQSESETDEVVEPAETVSDERVETPPPAETDTAADAARSEPVTPATVIPMPARNSEADRAAAAAIAEAATQVSDKAGRKGAQEMIKVPAQLIEDLVNLAGETSIARGRSEEQISELVFSLDEMQITVDRLQEQVRRLDIETEQQILYRQEQVESEGMEGFDPLEMDRYSQLQQLSRSLLESSSDLIDIKSTLADKARDMETLLGQQQRINSDLQEGLMRSRMVPFSRMTPRLRRIVRQVSSELNKRVDFKLGNLEGELDRTVLERMVAPLEHMLRNAVDHGIESPEQRQASGKDKRGTVSLDMSREGGEIVLVLADDGAGVNLEAVRAKAIQRGLMDADAELTDHEITQFILQAGFSTAETVTQISGRGVGMDVVHSEIKQLGGSMEIDSEPGQGTRFIVRLPFTVSVNRALMVSIAGNIYAIPLNTIEGIVRVSPFELEAYYQPDAPAFEYAGQPYQLRYMGGLLQQGEQPNLDGHALPLPVILVRGADHSVALQVDSLLGSREIVVKPLGPQFSMVQGLTGATVLGDGSVVVILDLLALIRADASYLHRDHNLLQDREQQAEDKNLLVMVVDDSVTVRKVTSRFLERQGMDVILAKDGVDAMTQLNEMDVLPDVMLLDIEMPRMDGFEVASRVRHTGRLENIPIIMITSRTGDKHRERALSLGVDQYMGKPYQETQLLENIHQLTGVASE